MKTLSDHIQESFNPVKEDNQQTVIENQTDNQEQEEVFNEDESAEKEKASE